MSALNQAQLQHFRQRLEGLRRELQGQVRDDLDQVAHDNVADIHKAETDAGDQAFAAQVMDLDQGMAQRHSMEWEEVEAALERIDDGEYGECIDCGADINPERLEAFPAAARCIDCQSQRERTYAPAAGPTI